MTGFRVLDLPPAHRRFLGCSMDLSSLEACLSTPVLATLAQLSSLILWRGVLVSCTLFPNVRDSRYWEEGQARRGPQIGDRCADKARPALGAKAQLGRLCSRKPRLWVPE